MANKRQRKKKLKRQGQFLFHCALCDKLLSAAGSNYVTGKRGVVCHSCLHTGHLVAIEYERKLKEDLKEDNDPEICSPQQLWDQLDQVVAGQEEAKRAVSLAIWKQQLRARGENVPANHLLLYGPTGCGKTYLVTQAAKLAGLPIHVFDATTLTESGYRGRDAADILKDYAAANKGRMNWKHGVILLDEADKMAAVGDPERQTFRRATQHALLKLMEGVEQDGLNSSKLLFVLAGAFPGIAKHKPRHMAPIGFGRVAEPIPEKNTVGTEDFIRFGMERELMGRVPGLAGIHPLSQSDLVQILLDKKDSVYRSYQEFFANHEVELELPEEAAYELARRALALGTGARALRAEMENVMEPLLFRLANGELKGKVTIDVSVSGLYKEIGQGAG